MVKKDGSKLKDVNRENDFSKSRDVDDKIIIGIYAGRYFKRNDICSKEQDQTLPSETKSVENSGISKCRPDANAMQNTKTEKHRNDDSDTSADKHRDNIKGMLVIVRLLTRSKKLTDELVKRYTRFYRIDEDIIRICEKQAHIDFEEYLLLIDSLV